MRIVRERPTRSAQEAPRHPEVDQENTTALEPKNQILAAALYGHDVFPFELGRHLGGLVRAHEARVVDAHPLEAPADERGLELPANALYLRQLRHIASVIVSPSATGRPTAPRWAARESRATASCRRARRSRLPRCPRTRLRGSVLLRSALRHRRAGARTRVSDPSTASSGRSRGPT